MLGKLIVGVIEKETRGIKKKRRKQTYVFKKLFALFIELIVLEINFSKFKLTDTQIKLFNYKKRKLMQLKFLS